MQKGLEGLRICVVKPIALFAKGATEMAEQAGMTEGMSEREKFIRGAQFCIHDEDAGNYLIGVIDVIREDRNRLRSENAAKDEEIARLGFAVRNVMEATGITLDNPSGDLADELANVMQAFIMDKSNDVKAVQAQLAQARRIPGCPEGMRVVKIGPLVFSDRGDIRQAWLEPSEEGAASQFHYDVSRDASGSIKFQINESDIPRAFHPLNAAENKGSTSPVSAEAPACTESESAIKYKHPGPVGTNFLDAEQAEAMVRHMIEGLPSVPAETPKVSIEYLGEVFMETGGSIYGSDQDLDNGIRAVARALGCEDRIEEEK